MPYLFSHQVQTANMDSEEGNSATADNTGDDVKEPYHYVSDSAPTTDNPDVTGINKFENREMTAKIAPYDEDPGVAMVSDNNYDNESDYIDEQIEEARQRIAKKADLLRQLQLAKTYRNRPETKNLDEVTAKWLEVCQLTLKDYYDKVKSHGENSDTSEIELGFFIEKLGIDKKLVKFNEVQQDFS